MPVSLNLIAAGGPADRRTITTAIQCIFRTDGRLRAKKIFYASDRIFRRRNPSSKDQLAMIRHAPM
jgi:hypothetical protein